MTSETRFLVPLARTLAIVLACVAVLGALLGAVVAGASSLTFRVPWWAGLLGGFAAFLLLLVAGRAAAHSEWCASWRDCLKR